MMKGLEVIQNGLIHDGTSNHKLFSERRKCLKKYIIESEGVTPKQEWLTQLQINHLKRLITCNILKKIRFVLTSEVLILNKEAVALAADSAATLSSEKIFVTNKIFMLSKYHPVGIMVYGNSQYMNVPWESIIKEYRKNELKEQHFGSLKGYVDNFVDYIKNDKTIFMKYNIDKRLTLQFSEAISNIFSNIREEILDDINDDILIKSTISHDEIKEIVNKIISRFEYDLRTNYELAPTITQEDIDKLLSKNRELIETLIKGIFENLPISEKYEDLVKLAIDSYVRIILGYQISGVVIVGFGDDDIFPSFYAIDIIGIINDIFRLSEPFHKGIGFNRVSLIVPFAQKDMVSRFMNGIDPRLRNFYSINCLKIFRKYREKIVDELGQDSSIKKSINEKLEKVDSDLTTDFDKLVDIFIKENYSDPITEIVAHLPKSDLAEMAESLVNLTSFKRHVSTDVETVGGPIDVALISKGDGFIWVKRKHYFKSDLNPQFHSNYYRIIKGDKLSWLKKK